MPLDHSKSYPIRPRLLDNASYLGIRGYFITINTHNRMKFFTQKNIVSSLVSYLQKAANEYAFDVVVYCFMPDHVHLVLNGQTEESNLLTFIKMFKQKTGFLFRQVHKKQLWSTSFYDRVLRKTEDIRGVGRYTLANPVKANLVSNALEYPYSGSFVYSLKELIQSDIPAYYTQV